MQEANYRDLLLEVGLIAGIEVARRAMTGDADARLAWQTFLGQLQDVAQRARGTASEVVWEGLEKTLDGYTPASTTLADIVHGLKLPSASASQSEQASADLALRNVLVLCSQGQTKP